MLPIYHINNKRVSRATLKKHLVEVVGWSPAKAERYIKQLERLESGDTSALGQLDRGADFCEEFERSL